MKRITAILLMLAFVVGTITLPALHQAHCTEGAVEHSSSPCPICQLIHAPLVLDVAEPAFVNPPAASLPVLVTPRPLLAAVPGGSTQARAPPVT